MGRRWPRPDNYKPTRDADPRIIMATNNPHVICETYEYLVLPVEKCNISFHSVNLGNTRVLVEMPTTGCCPPHLLDYSLINSRLSATAC